jgi:2-oxoglutarate ferredoxin oxidoreductase subunit gamma
MAAMNGKHPMRIEICIAGFGGQGIGLAALILGKALAIYDGYEAVMTQSYGPEARGGASSANIVVSDETVDYPFVQHPDILVVLSQEAYEKFQPTVKPDALILIDEDLVMPHSGEKCFAVPATRLAEELGRRIVSNVVMLGFFCAKSGLIELPAVEASIRDSIKAKAVDLNLKALAAGFEYGKQPPEGLQAFQTAAQEQEWSDE